MKLNKNVVVALSGGVDSSVAALILKKKGYNVIGLFMYNWEDNKYFNKKCNLTQDGLDAMLIAEKINIPFQIINLKYEYKKYIINYMYSEYSKGNTPNPDILCNKYIKFNFFLKKAFSLGFNNIATGHYARIKKITKNGKLIYRLLSAIDYNKDQSYFLCQLNQYQLSRSIFPLGEYNKKTVRKIAYEAGLITANKKDSQGLCFVGKICLKDFLKHKINSKKGYVINISNNSILYNKNNKKIKYNSKLDELTDLSKDIIYKIDDGEIVGTHDGAHVFTKGQRKGIGIGGYKEAIFVIGIDIKNNIVYTGIGKNHPGLYKKIIFIKKNKINWIRDDLKLNNIKNNMNVLCRIRYRQPLQNAILYKIKDGIFIEFEKHQLSVSKGQFAAWYLNEEIIGSGVIS